MSEKLLYLLSYCLSKCINFFGHVPKQPKRILVIKKDEIGDLVTSLHVFKHLHQLYPKAAIHAQVRPFNQVFFSYLNYVNTIEQPNGKYDLIVDLRGDFNSLFYALWHMPWYRADRGSVRFKNKFTGGQKNELITNYEVINDLLSSNTARLDNTITYSEKETKSVEHFLSTKQISKYALIHIGARDAARRWPIDRYQKIIAYLNQQGIHCLLAGGPSDILLNESCISGIDRSMNHNLAGLFDLLEFAAFCTNAALFIGNESGPLHIASAQNTPVVALFGPGVKDVFYPLGNKVFIHHYFLQKGHKEQTIENSTIFQISVDEVKSSINKVLGFEN